MNININVYKDCTSDEPTKTYTIKRILFKTAKELTAIQAQSKTATDEEQTEITLKMLQTVIPEFTAEDLDGVDQEAYHVYLRDNGKIVAYLRVVDKGNRLDEVSIGRVITLKRRCGYGKILMEAGLKVAREKYGASVVKVGAQVEA